MSRIGVLGAGSWGTALADLLARKGHDVRLWAYEPDVVAAINTDHQNPIYLSDAPLSSNLAALADPVAVVEGTDCVVMASPSHVTRRVFESVAAALPAGTLVASATKGLETDSLNLMSDVAAAVLPPHRFVALSGPSFAREVYQQQPTAVVAAAHDLEAAQAVQDLFATGYFRVYSNTDLVGTQLAGALKNVIAIAAGILDGLGLGHNPRAALITRGLAEIARLGGAMGADPSTFAGLAGMGDLVLTTTGALSRNRALGVAIAHGETLEQHRQKHRTVAEGATTAAAAVRLAQRHGVELPIIAQIADVLYAGTAPRDAISQLMERDLKPEQWT
ncbi:MAG: NAD(P)H-dependent glycerol-3-phosphate dehydrogenase [Gemmatimonadales bacterium]